MRSSDSTFGLTDGDWEIAKSELRQAILRAAWQRRMTWYGEIAPQVEITRVDSVFVPYEPPSGCDS